MGTDDDRELERQFPRLFCAQPFTWGGIGDSRLQIDFSTPMPPAELIGNVKAIGRCGDGIAVFETDQGWRSVPSGTREPGEAIAETGAG